MKSAGSRRLRKGSLKWLTLIVGSLGAALIVVWLTCAYTGGMEYAAANGHTTLLRSYLLLPGTNVNKAETLWGQTPPLWSGDKWPYGVCEITPCGPCD